MEQDEVYHHAMDAAGNNLKNWRSGVDKDGRPLANAARSQRQAIQSEQVLQLPRWVFSGLDARSSSGKPAEHVK